MTVGSAANSAKTGSRWSLKTFDDELLGLVRALPARLASGSTSPGSSKLPSRAGAGDLDDAVEHAVGRSAASAKPRRTHEAAARRSRPAARASARWSAARVPLVPSRADSSLNACSGCGRLSRRVSQGAGIGRTERPGAEGCGDPRRRSSTPPSRCSPQRGYRSGALGRDRRAGSTSPRPAILYHFGSKEALLLAVIAERDRRAGTSLADFPARRGLGVAASVVRIRRAQRARARPDRRCTPCCRSRASTPQSPTHAYFRERNRLRARPGREHAASTRSAPAKSAPTSTAPPKADEFIAFLEGAAVLWLLDRSVSLVGLYESYIETFIAAVATPTS